MTIGIQDISVYLPPSRQSNLSLLEQFDITEDFLVDKVGVTHRPVRGAHENTSDMALLALERLIEQSNIAREKIQVLIVVTQNPDSRLPHVSGLLHGRAGLARHCAAFDISLGCSGYVYGLSIISSFMQSNGWSAGVLITCDPYSKIIDPNDKGTVLLFGDAATATLVSDSPNFVCTSFDFGSQGDLDKALYEQDGLLHMDGRKVFNFAVQSVPQSVSTLLHKAGLNISDIDAYLFHQGSRYIVEALAKRLKLDRARVRISMASTGNTVSSSIPILLAEEIKNTTSSCILLCGFGVGLSWASCICQRLERY